jgi:hypothetical protein
MFNIQTYNEISQKIDFLGKKTKIIAVSKNHPKSAIELAISHGVKIFGENRVQEAKAKFDNLKKHHPSLELHLTGPLQTNKVKEALNLFDVFHTLDREKLAKEFVKVGSTENKKFFIQVNTGKEKTKSGIYLEELRGFVNYCKFDLSLNIIGLMCIPPISDQPKMHFSILADEAKKNNLSQLSIGMSADYLEAIKFNANYIRIGTALFGERKK